MLTFTLDSSSLPPQMIEAVWDALAPKVRRELATVLQEYLPNPTELDDGISRSRTASKLGCSLVTLRELEKRKELVPYRVGRRVMYRKADVEAFMQGRQ